MKVIIAGPRDLDLSVELVDRIVKDCGLEITELVSGVAQGVDFSGECWAAHFNIPIKLFEAQWETHGKSAGAIRNREMAEYADVLLAIKWARDTPGTKNMIDIMNRKKKPVHVHVVATEETVDDEDQD